jgi:hypothetical protein
VIGNLILDGLFFVDRLTGCFFSLGLMLSDLVQRGDKTEKQHKTMIVVDNAPRMWLPVQWRGE